jgi:hypothetical protein
MFENKNLTAIQIKDFIEKCSETKDRISSEYEEQEKNKIDINNFIDRTL